MSTRELTCIVCPMGCRMRAEIDGEDIRVSGNSCKRGVDYAVQEIARPMRAVTSLIAVEGAAHPLCPVKTNGLVAKDRIDEVIGVLHGAVVKAPVRVGQVLIADVAGTGVDIVATANR